MYTLGVVTGEYKDLVLLFCCDTPHFNNNKFELLLRISSC